MLLAQADQWAKLLHDGENVAINIVQHGADFELKVRHVQDDVEKTYTDVRDLMTDLSSGFRGTDKPSPVFGSNAPVVESPKQPELPSSSGGVAYHLQTNLAAIKEGNTSPSSGVV